MPQYLAAKILKSNSWRFHKHFRTWFQRSKEPVPPNFFFLNPLVVFIDFLSLQCFTFHGFRHFSGFCYFGPFLLNFGCFRSIFAVSVGFRLLLNDFCRLSADFSNEKGRNHGPDRARVLRLLRLRHVVELPQQNQLCV